MHLPIACGDAGQQPVYDLPVSANPAMTSCSIGKICRGVIFVKRNITQQARAGKAALKKIVTEHLVVRKASGQHGVKCIQVVNALSDV